MKGIVLLTFDGVQLTLPDLVKSLGIILGAPLLLEKQINASAKKAFFQLSLARKVAP